MNEAHTQPVNKTASKVFWKAPWWAKLNEDVREAISDLPIIDEKVLVDYTKAPPNNPSKLLQIEDKRSRKIVWKNGDFGIVIGFSHTITKSQPRNKARPQPSWWIGSGWNPYHIKREYHSYHWWWVLVNNVEIRCIKWATKSDRAWVEKVKLS